MAGKECWICGETGWGRVIPQKTIIGTTKDICAEGTGCNAARAKIAADAKRRRKQAFGKLLGRG